MTTRALALVVSLFVCALGCAATAQEQTAPDDADVWGNQEVRAYVQQYGPDSPLHDDPFVVPPAPPAPVRQVVIELPVYQANPRSQSGARWSYARDKQMMTVRIQEDDILDQVRLDVRQLMSLAPRQAVVMRGWGVDGSQRGPQTEQFVGNQRITVQQRIFFGFGEVATTTLPTRWPVKSYDHTWAIEPEAARALSENLVVQVLGITKPWVGDDYIICGNSYDIGVLRGGNQWRFCYLTGELRSYRLVDKRDGSVIREWDVSLAAIA